jgi:hypothetical protein
MNTISTIRKVLKARDIPPSWGMDLPNDPDAPVAVTVGPAEPPARRRRLTDFIGAGRGVHATREEADAHLDGLRGEWQA